MLGTTLGAVEIRKHWDGERVGTVFQGGLFEGAVLG